MKKGKIAILIFVLLLFIISIKIFRFAPTNDYEKYQGENNNGSITLERDKQTYKYNFTPSKEIVDAHLPGDGYTFDFYTSDSKFKVNCTINVFTDNVKDTIHSQFEYNSVNKKPFTKVVITTKIKKYEIELEKINN